MSNYSVKDIKSAQSFTLVNVLLEIGFKCELSYNHYLFSLARLHLVSTYFENTIAKCSKEIILTYELIILLLYLI